MIILNVPGSIDHLWRQNASPKVQDARQKKRIVLTGKDSCHCQNCFHVWNWIVTTTMLFASLTRGSSVAHSKLNIVYERQYPVCHLSFFMHPLDTRRYVYRLSTRKSINIPTPKRWTWGSITNSLYRRDGTNWVHVVPSSSDRLRFATSKRTSKRRVVVVVLLQWNDTVVVVVVV